jgi:hypothetical protein
VISILFPSGAYGSTLEYCIRRFSKEFDTVYCDVSDTGSMHGFDKNFHITTPEQLVLLNDTLDIITPVYPTRKLSESMTTTINNVKVNELIKQSSVIFITLPSISSIVRNKLNVYYKLPNKSVLFNGVQSIKNWNPSYTNVNQLECWEKREAVSLIDNNAEFISAQQLAHQSWLTITSDDILYDLPSVIIKIINYLCLTLTDDGIDEFYKIWFDKQQYILKLCNLIDTVVESTINNHSFKWDKVDLIVEALIQHKLRLHGYELQCYNLNEFPTDSATLRRLFV